jgi:MFS family permease
VAVQEGLVSTTGPRAALSISGGLSRSDIRVTAVGAVAYALTAPGQTAAVSVFVDPVVAELGISRTAVSTAYLVGTLGGAAAMPLVGRALDRHGARAVLLAVGGLLGGVLVALSAVSGLVGLTAGFVGIRFAGQGALTLAATTLVAYYVTRRLGTAVGLVTAVGSAAISLAPLGLERLIAAHDFRLAWLVQGLLVWVVIVPLAIWGLPRRSRLPGPAVSEQVRPRGGLGPVLRAPMFWVVTGGVGVLALVGTGLTFHQIAVLGERGLSTAQAAATFLPQTVAGLVSTLLVGILLDRVSPRPVMVGSMVMLVVALAAAAFASPGWSAVGYGVALGAAGNSFRTVEAAALPRYFGTEHIGAVRGVVHAVTVAASAVGPLLFALGHGWLGSYRPVVLMLVTLPLVLGVATVSVREPHAVEVPA